MEHLYSLQNWFLMMKIYIYLIYFPIKISNSARFQIYSKCEIHYKRLFDLFLLTAFTKGNISVVVKVRTASISSCSILIKSSSHIKMFNMTATQLIMYLQYVVELPLGYYWFCLFDFNAYSLSQYCWRRKGCSF